MKRIPLTLITGFLGAGKSTLINQIINELGSIKLGLLVNEFGDVALETQFLQAAKDDIVELSSGCMCCVIRDDLVQTVRQFLDRRPEIEHIIIEASGLSDPFPIAQTFVQDTIDGRVRFDSVVTVLDASNFEMIIDNFVTSIKQIKLADFVVLSKLDLVEQKQLDRIKHQVSILAPKVPQLSTQDPFLVQLILDSHDFDHEHIAQQKIVYKDTFLSKRQVLTARAGAPSLLRNNSYQVFHEPVSTLFYRTEKLMSRAKIVDFLDSLPSEIIRIKGFLFLESDESSLSKALVQSVCQRTSIEHVAWQEGELKQSALVLIARNLDMTSLKAKLETCLVV